MNASLRMCTSASFCTIWKHSKKAVAANLFSWNLCAVNASCSLCYTSSVDSKMHCCWHALKNFLLQLILIKHLFSASNCSRAQNFNIINRCLQSSFGNRKTFKKKYLQEWSAFMTWFPHHIFFPSINLYYIVTTLFQVKMFSV